MTPSGRILDFLAKQPETIRDNLYCQAGLDSADDDEIAPETDFALVTQKFLSSNGDWCNFRHAIFACGMLDFVFSRPPRGAEFAKHLAEEANRTGSVNLNQMALQTSLRDEHFE